MQGRQNIRGKKEIEWQKDEMEGKWSEKVMQQEVTNKQILCYSFL